MEKKPLEKISLAFAAFAGLCAPLFLVRFGLGELRGNLLDVALLFSGLIIGAANLPALRQNFQKNAFFWLGSLFFFLAVCLSWFLGESSPRGLGFIKSFLFLPISFAFFAAINKKFLFSAIEGMFWGTVLLSLFGIGAALKGDFTFDGRLAYPFSSPNELALALSPQILIGFFWLRPKPKGRLIQGILYASLIILLLSTYLTFSYAAWGALALGFLFPFFFSKNKKSLYLVLLAVLAVLFLLAFSQASSSKGKALWEMSERSSLASRLMIWKASFKIIADHPFFGTGPGSFQETYLSYQRFFPPYLEWAVPHPHNIFLAVFLYGGMPGLFFFLFVLAISLSNSFYLAKSVPNKKMAALGATILSFYTYFIAIGLFDTPYWRGDLSLGFWLITAASLLSEAEKSHKSIR
ncbi:MAG TPA: O-antigen ligase family protein [Candidatus Moranbacteria bacterium]|nr:O-antigen ligase family protein [Candidatus Moranbacteria bacterium]